MSFAFDHGSPEFEVLAGQNSRFCSQCRRSGSPEAGLCHCDVMMAEFVNLAHQICCSAHWEPIFEVRP